MESSCKHEVVVGRELLEAAIEFALVYEASSFIDDNERIDNPKIDSEISTRTAPVAAASAYMLRFQAPPLT